MHASLLRTERLRRGLALFGIASILGTFTLVAACYGEGADSNDTEIIPTNSVYVPAEAAAQNPPAPGITPGTPGTNEPRPDPPPDSGTPSDSGSNPNPPGDSGPSQPDGAL